MSSAVAPERIGRYEIYSEIASGGMATVCFGRQIGHVGFARTVAIKRLHRHVARDPEFVQMFLDEARLATRIQNPHVVQTLDVVAAGGELLLVMEYVHGEALSKLLTTMYQRKERIEPRIAMAIAVGMLEGLHAAHEARSERGIPLEIVHRDVSPQNVLVGMDGIARVFDFGIAKASDRIHTTQDGSLKGKIAYMAPEQLENTSVDRRADVWAASVVLWEMLAGRRLFVADSQAALIRVVLTREIPPVSALGLPKRLDEILRKGLARDRIDRYASATEMALDLEEALAPAPVRVVAAWASASASTDLDTRAQVLEEVGDQAASLRPSGATKVEVAALINDEATTVKRDAFVDDPETTPGRTDPDTFNDEPTITTGDVARMTAPAIPPLHPSYAEVDLPEEDTTLHSKAGVSAAPASRTFDDSDETRNVPIAPPPKGLPRPMSGLHSPTPQHSGGWLPSEAPRPSLPSSGPSLPPSLPPSGPGPSPVLARPTRASGSFIAPGAFVAGVLVLLLIAAQLHRRTASGRDPSHLGVRPDVTQTAVAAPPLPTLPPPPVIIAPYATGEGTPAATSPPAKPEPGGSRSRHPRQPSGPTRR